MNDAAQIANLHAIVLAAGASSRFGSPKQLARLDGRPMLHSAVSRAVEVAGHSVTVVLGAHASTIAPLLRHSPAGVTINRNWRDGLASSIRAGVASVTGAADGVLLMLGDQPNVSAEDLRRLVGAWRAAPQSLAAAQYGATTGVPAVIPRWCFAELAALSGDRGAQLLMHRHTDRLIRVRMPSAALDVDRPEDLLDFESQRAPRVSLAD